MKTILTSIIAVALLTSCSTVPTSIINTGIIAGVTTTLKLVEKDPVKRAQIANYIDVYATALRSITGEPTADQLTIQINAFIPASVKSALPELVTFVTPLVVSNYKALYDKYAATGNGAKIVAGLNAFAADLEAGASPYITKG